jgi:hypothetical protein
VEGESAFDLVLRERPPLNGRKADVSINPTWSVVSAKIVEPDTALIVVGSSLNNDFLMSACKKRRAGGGAIKKTELNIKKRDSVYVTQVLFDSPNQLL